MAPASRMHWEPFCELAPDAPRASRLDDVRIRRATLTDLDAITQIVADRENAEPETVRSKIGRAIGASIDKQLVLAAEYQRVVIAVGRVGYFTPPKDAPQNVAPTGWYLFGAIVTPAFRRRGIGRQLTAARLAWIRERAARAYYFANVKNRVSIAMHHEFGFMEVTREFVFPGAAFDGGVGALFKVDLT